MNTPNYNKMADRNNKMFCMHFSVYLGNFKYALKLINNESAGCKSSLKAYPA